MLPVLPTFSELFPDPLGYGEEFAETQLRTCCRDLPGEMLNTGRGNYSEGKLIYFIRTEGKGKGEDNLCLA